MAQYPSITTTYAGLNMIAESQTGKKLIFTKLKAGDGSLSDGESIQNLTALKSPKLDIPIQGFVNQGNGQIRLRFVVSNENVESGFHMKEVGIYAKVEESGEEQLYAYVNGGNFVDWIPDKNIPMEAQIFDIFVIIGNASSVIVNIDKSIVYATALDLAEHNTNKDAHANGIKGNAASATKLQTARKINGVSFDGTTDITITDDTKSPATHTHNYAGSSSAGGVANSAKDSDTVDGKHATDFAPSGFGLGGEVTLVKSGSANSIVDTGFYNTTSDVTDLPTSSWYYLIVMRHHPMNPSTDSKKYTKQLAYSLEPAKDGTNMHERTRYNGTWTEWKQIATTAFVQSFFEDNFTIIYPNGGTKDSPANVAVNSRYVMDNPFQGYHVMCVAEVYYNSKWGETGYLYSPNAGDGSTGGCGVKATVNNGQIVVQTGTLTINSASSHLGNGFGNETIAIVTPMPCRVKVWKVGKIS